MKYKVTYHYKTVHGFKDVTAYVTYFKTYEEVQDFVRIGNIIVTKVNEV